MDIFSYSNKWKGSFCINYSNYNKCYNRETVIILYKIIKKHQKPFIMFGLYNKDNLLDFYRDNIVKNSDMATIFMRRKYFDNKDCLKYRGFSNDNIIWIEYIEDEFEPLLCKKYDQFLWCLSTEILNIKKVLDVSISKEVTSFFEKNPDYLFITNEEGAVYETPTVCYRGYCEENMLTTLSLGLQRETLIKKLGPSYWLSSFDSSIDEALIELNNSNEPKYERCGLIRMAVFLGVSTVIEYKDNNLECLNDSEMNISEWFRQYSSIYLLYYDNYKILLKDIDYVCLSYNYMSSTNFSVL